jgi:hypothetical protein
MRSSRLAASCSQLQLDGWQIASATLPLRVGSSLPDETSSCPNQLRTIAVALLLLSPAHGQDIDSTSHTVQFVAVENNVKLEVLDWGGSGRPLVLLAGLGDTAHVFDKFAPKLTGAYHV